MSNETPRKRLPDNPSIEHLRKQAKRLAKREGLALAEAQAKLAADYGFGAWPKLVAHVERAATPDDAPVSPLSRAAGAGDVGEVRRLLAQGASAEGQGETSAPLWHACSGDGSADARLAIADMLIAAGAPVRRENAGGAPAICAAAARGPRELVEKLIRAGAPAWQGDRKGRDALDYARAGSAPDRESIIHLLDRPVIDDPAMRAAAKAIQTGDVAGLSALLDRHPDLLRMRAREPDCYGQDYFRDPKLFWFVAYNPIPPNPPPRNIVAIAEAMIARGVEQADLDYALGLTMTGASLRRHRLQMAMIAALLGAGAKPGDMLGELGHREQAAVEAVLKAGHPVDAVIAAGTGRIEDFRRLLPQATEKERLDAFSVAVINEEVACAALCLDAGVNVSAFLTAHRHSTASHQAAINNDVAMLEMLVARGADLSVRDTLWNGTPHGWAVHGRKRRAQAYLEGVLGRR